MLLFERSMITNLCFYWITTLPNIHYASWCYLYLNLLIWLQLKKYFQPRKSHRTASVNLEGLRVPLYGAGSALNETSNGFQVPLELKFEIRSRGHVVGKLVTTRHRRRISCSLVIDSTKSKPIKFRKNSCTYGWSPQNAAQCTSPLAECILGVWRL